MCPFSSLPYPEELRLKRVRNEEAVLGVLVEAAGGKGRKKKRNKKLEGSLKTLCHPVEPSKRAREAYR